MRPVLLVPALHTSSSEKLRLLCHHPHQATSDHRLMCSGRELCLVTHAVGCWCCAPIPIKMWHAFRWRRKAPSLTIAPRLPLVTLKRDRLARRSCPSGYMDPFDLELVTNPGTRYPCLSVGAWAHEPLSIALRVACIRTGGLGDRRMTNPDKIAAARPAAGPGYAQAASSCSTCII
jgi:hypothetical protein